jgi:hypothetical protein
MIGTYLYNGQGLGNQLWSYYTLRLLAIMNNCDFALLGSEAFKGKSFIDLDTGVSCNHPKRNQPCNELFSLFENYYEEPQLLHLKEYCDTRSFDKNLLLVEKNTLIDGYFQSENLGNFINHDIHSLMQFVDIPELNYLGDKDICVLNIRGGEYKSNKRLTLNKRYWINAINIMKQKRNIKKFYIVTDDLNYSQKLLPGLEVLDQNIHHDFVGLSKAKNLILSNSSFAYFPVILNKNNPFIIAPKYWARHNVSDGFWACSSNIYKDYNYLDRQGQLISSDTCRKEAIAYQEKYANYFRYIGHNYHVRYPNRVWSALRNRITFYV